jgi:hypothetical protein
VYSSPLYVIHVASDLIRLVYSSQLYVIHVASDLIRLVIFSGYICFINIQNIPPQYNWYIVESDVKHHNPYTLLHSYKLVKNIFNTSKQTFSYAWKMILFAFQLYRRQLNVTSRLAILNYSMFFLYSDANWKYGTKMNKYMVWLEKYIFLTSISVTAYQTRHLKYPRMPGSINNFSGSPF